MPGLWRVGQGFVKQLEHSGRGENSTRWTFAGRIGTNKTEGAHHGRAQKLVGQLGGTP